MDAAGQLHKLESSLRVLENNGYDVLRVIGGEQTLESFVRATHRVENMNLRSASGGWMYAPNDAWAKCVSSIVSPNSHDTAMLCVWQLQTSPPIQFMRRLEKTLHATLSHYTLALKCLDLGRIAGLIDSAKWKVVVRDTPAGAPYDYRALVRREALIGLHGAQCQEEANGLPLEMRKPDAKMEAIVDARFLWLCSRVIQSGKFSSRLPVIVKSLIRRSRPFGELPLEVVDQIVSRVFQTGEPWLHFALSLQQSPTANTFRENAALCIALLVHAFTMHSLVEEERDGGHGVWFWLNTELMRVRRQTRLMMKLYKLIGGTIVERRFQNTWLPRHPSSRDSPPTLNTLMVCRRDTYAALKSLSNEGRFSVEWLGAVMSTLSTALHADITCASPSVLFRMYPFAFRRVLVAVPMNGRLSQVISTIRADFKWVLSTPHKSSTSRPGVHSVPMSALESLALGYPVGTPRMSDLVHVLVQLRV